MTQFKSKLKNGDKIHPEYNPSFEILSFLLLLE